MSTNKVTILCANTQDELLFGDRFFLLQPGEPARRSQRLQQQRKRQLQEWEDEDALVRAAAAASKSPQSSTEFGIMHQLEKHRGRGRPSK